MATTLQIFEVRLRISDPAGFISFIEVADTASLPTDPASQTAYLVTADGNYYSTEKTIGATPADYSIEELKVSDVRISAWIDAADVDTATCMALKAIISQIGQSMQIKRNDAGADSTEYQSLKDTYEYYKGLLLLCSEEKQSNNNNNSGRYSGTVQPEIGGGNL